MTLANYLRMEAAVALLDGVDEALAESVRGRMDAVWRGLSPHDIAYLNSRNMKQPEHAPHVKAPFPHCDATNCVRPPAFRCACPRCSPSGGVMSEIKTWHVGADDTFHACEEHVGSSEIGMQHMRVYPGHVRCFVRPGETGLARTK